MQPASHKITGNSFHKVLVVLIFYWLMATAYYFTILYNVQSSVLASGNFWNGESYSRILLDYSLKLILTVPVWLLIFRVFESIVLWKRIMLHFLTLPLFIFLWKASFYYLCELLGYGHLKGNGEIWDVYIPFLFYILQFALFHVYHYYQQLQEQQRLSAELKQHAFKSEITTLKAQIHPHFLFNTLNSISAGLPIEQEHTRQSIARLADTFRYAMNTAQKEHILFRDELHFIQNYLALEQERFSDRLEVIYSIDPLALDTSVPPFLLQPLVENALKHGIGKSVEGGIIQLSVKIMNDKINYEVLDTGAGLNGYSPKDIFIKGIGLQNTRLRLLKLYNEEITICNNSPKGTKVLFSIPLNNLHDRNENYYH
ncbi:MAG TPA: histidine kinase [Flavisolibacter sp.]|nr:histidine kinase [Flavisolibacter sp.]